MFLKKSNLQLDKMRPTPNSGTTGRPRTGRRLRATIRISGGGYRLPNGVELAPGVVTEEIIDRRLLR